MLESALIMLVFLPVLIGIMDFGQLLYFHQALSERTRVAAHWGVNTFDATQFAIVAIYNDPAGTAFRLPRVPAPPSIIGLPQPVQYGMVSADAPRAGNQCGVRCAHLPTGV